MVDVLDVDFRAVLEVSLEGFAQKRVEQFQLVDHVEEAREHETDHELEPLESLRLAQGRFALVHFEGVEGVVQVVHVPENPRHAFDVRSGNENVHRQRKTGESAAEGPTFYRLAHDFLDDSLRRLQKFLIGQDHCAFLRTRIMLFNFGLFGETVALVKMFSLNQSFLHLKCIKSTCWNAFGCTPKTNSSAVPGCRPKCCGSKWAKGPSETLF